MDKRVRLIHRLSMRCDPRSLPGPPSLTSAVEYVTNSKEDAGLVGSHEAQDY